MLSEEFAEVVQIISGIAKKVQLVTDKNKEITLKIEKQISKAEDLLEEHKVAAAS